MRKPILLPPKNDTVDFETSDGYKHRGWHSGTRWHSYQKPYITVNEPDHDVVSWERIKEP